MQTGKRPRNMSQIERYTNYTDSPCEYERLNWLYNTISRRRKKGRLVRILDVGCGNGKSTIPLGLIEFSEVKGIDLREEFVQLGKQRNSLQNVTISSENLFNCSISAYDFIILTDVLEYSESYRKVLRYIAKEGHPLVEIQVTVSNGFGPLELIMRPWYQFRNWCFRAKLSTKTQKYPVNFFTVQRLRREMDRFGLEVVEVKKAYVFSPLLQTLFPSFSLRRFAKADNFLAQLLPKFLVSSHYYRVRKKRNHLKVVWKRG